MTTWDALAAGFLAAFMGNGLRAAWRVEPHAHWWRKVLNIKARPWTWIDGALLGGFVLCVILSGNGELLLDPTPNS